MNKNWEFLLEGLSVTDTSHGTLLSYFSQTQRNRHWIETGMFVQEHMQELGEMIIHAVFCLLENYSFVPVTSCAHLSNSNVFCDLCSCN